MRNRYIVYWADNTATHLTMRRRGKLSLGDIYRIAKQGKEERGCKPTSIHRFPL